jgi:hypothetical protein
MKNASFHDKKMEVYCNAMRALKDKFYDIELNHVPRKYNEEAGELVKITSGRTTVPPERFRARRRQTIRRPQFGPLESGGTLGGSLESSGCGTHGRGPLERGVRPLPARGVRRRRSPGHGNRVGPHAKDWRAKYLT